MSDKIRIGIVGTSWWADAMYLPALAKHPLADVRGIVGGSRKGNTRELAAKWGIPGAFDTLEELFAAGPLDALFVLTPDTNHFTSVMAGLERGLHVLCEKPMGLNAREAREMAEAAARAGVVTMVPFTYRFMPNNRYIKELIDQGWLGRPHHLNMRYYADYGRSGTYAWRFDTSAGGSGVSGDLGSHWAFLARWFYGEIDAVSAVFSHVVPRAPRPDNAPYEAAEDSAVIALEFANGAIGSLHVSSLACEPGPFGQRHEMDLHGSDGTLHTVNDWVRLQRVEGCRVGDEGRRELPIPDHLFGSARRDVVGDTYKDTFREHDHMARGFVSAIARGEAATPDFNDGLAVQRVLEAASRSAREARRVTIAEIIAGGG